MSQEHTLNPHEKERIRRQLTEAFTRHYNEWMYLKRQNGNLPPGYFLPGERMLYRIPMQLKIAWTSKPVKVTHGLAKHFVHTLNRRGHWIATLHWHEDPKECKIELWHAHAIIRFLYKHRTACVIALLIIFPLCWFVFF